MNDEDLVLKDIERCKKLEPIMNRLGIKPDGYWLEMENGDIHFHGPELQLSGCIKTYRQDKLALALPEWVRTPEVYDFCFAFGLPGIEIEGAMLNTISEMYERIISNIGQAHIEATADLLILLEEEKILKEDNDDKEE